MKTLWYPKLEDIRVHHTSGTTSSSSGSSSNSPVALAAECALVLLGGVCESVTVRF